MSMKHEVWEVVDTKDSRLSPLIDGYRMNQEIEQVYEELGEVSNYVDGRVDLRDLDTYAIDPADAQDRDDAFSVQREIDANGELDGYTAWVHIADAAEYVPEDGTIDRHAEQQGFTVYGYGTANHMLPEELVSDISFKEREDRLANTFELSFDEEGELQAYDIYASIVNTDLTMSYDNANYHMWKSDDASWLSASSTGVTEDLQDAAFLSTRLADAGDRTFGRDAAHRIVEEFMVKANEIGANELLAAGRGLYRNHVNEVDSEIGRVMEAHYSPECHAHNGLGVDQYAHFTAPIRRYVDLVNWRIIREETDRTEGELYELATHLNQQQSRVKGQEIGARA